MRDSVTCQKYAHANVEIVCQTTQHHVETEEAPVIASAVRASTIAFLSVLVWIFIFNFNTVKAKINEMLKGKKKKAKRN